MNLIQAIESLTLQGQTPEQVRTTLQADVVTHRDSTPKNYAEMVRSFGLQAAESILQALQGAGLHGAAALYTGNGIDLSLDVSQQQLTALAIAVPSLAEVCEALRLAGKRTAPQWQACGLDEMPSNEAITTALASVTDSQAIATFFNETINPLVSSGASKTEIKAAVAAW